MTDSTHVLRVEKELRNAGISRIGMLRFTSTYLPNVIHQDEHVLAAVYGHRREGSGGVFGYEEGLLVATDRRVLYVIHRPGYTSMDEIAYDKLSGIHVSRAIPFAAVTLFTKIGDYTLSFARPKVAQKFADYIEQSVIDLKPQVTTDTKTLETFEQPIDAVDVVSFLSSHEIGVVSTIDRKGSISGAVIYYTMLNNRPYFMTKSGTKKVENVLGDQHVALTVFDEPKRQTVQMQGIVQIEPDKNVADQAFGALYKTRRYGDGQHLPPVEKMSGNTIIFRILPTTVHFTDYSKR